MKPRPTVSDAGSGAVDGGRRRWAPGRRRRGRSGRGGGRRAGRGAAATRRDEHDDGDERGERWSRAVTRVGTGAGSSGHGRGWRSTGSRNRHRRLSVPHERGARCAPSPDRASRRAAPRVASVANMSGMSNRDPRATLMSTPRPRSPPAHSATIAPMTASVTPTRIPPRIAGSAAGISTGRTTCAFVARNDRAISISRGSTERRPTIVATATGKNTISVVMTSLLGRPVPNHRAMSGASARIGGRLGRDEIRAEQPLREPRPARAARRRRARRWPRSRSRAGPRRASSRSAATSCHRSRRGRSAGRR